MRRSGFTLIEVLLALGLVALLVAALGVFVNQVSDNRVDIRAYSERESMVTSMFDALDAAVGTCIARAGDGSSGFSGDAFSVGIAFDAATVQRALETTPERVLLPGGRLDVAFSPGPGTLSVTRDRGPGRDLGPRCFAVRFRYHDGSRWQDEWDSIRMGRLPHALECSIWFDPWSDETIPEWFPEGYDELPDDEGFGDELDDFGSFDEFESSRPVDLDELLETFGSDEAGGSVLDDGSPEPDRRRIFAIPDAEQPDEDTFFEGSLLPEFDDFMTPDPEEVEDA
jgi:prepilin-type N-terminal cleavage/methylation domain-containing protein